MTDRRNPTQDLLETAAAVRAYNGAMLAIAAWEGVRPLERRRLHRLAALVALTPCDRRA